PTAPAADVVASAVRPTKRTERSQMFMIASSSARSFDAGNRMITPAAAQPTWEWAVNRNSGACQA
ncbi:MAG TPA: hypothetical protein PKI77_19245, partial [Mycobacterium sp.]|nr:hypothetical protein [Mycobacterium sp.]